MFRYVLAALGALSLMSSEGAAHSASIPAVSSVTITRAPAPDFGGPFSLTDQNGKARASRDFRGTPMLIYFGYTNCTDACPLDAQTITNVVDLLDRRGLTVAPIFITVDPRRDTPDQLKQFLSSFHPRFVRLTGPVERVTKIATAYGASGEGDQLGTKKDGGYDVLHAAIGYLVGRNGEFLDLVRLKGDPDEIATHVAEAVDTADHPGNSDSQFVSRSMK